MSAVGHPCCSSSQIERETTSRIASRNHSDEGSHTKLHVVARSGQGDRANLARHARPQKDPLQLLPYICGYGHHGLGSGFIWTLPVRFKELCFLLQSMHILSVKVLSTTTVSKMLNVLREWFAHHGIPEHIVIDNGPQFMAEDFEIFTECNGIKSAPYHPASNGLAEHFIKSMKQSLKASEGDGRSLIQRLSCYLLNYRSTAHSTTGVPPCQLLVGRDLRTHLSLIQPSCEKTVVEKQSQQKSSHDRRSRPRAWIARDRVFGIIMMDWNGFLAQL